MTEGSELEGDAEETFIFDPRDLIGRGIDPCPQCEQPNSLGLLSVGNYRAIKRCRNCLHTTSIELPPAPKQLIYLDQHAVSHLCKSIHPDTRKMYLPGNARTQDGFWPHLFDRLDRLHKLHLISCPQSGVQRYESLLDARLRKELETLYEHLSGGLRLESTDAIWRAQVYECFAAWLAGRVPNWREHQVFSGRTDDWLDRLRISVSMGWEDEEAAEARALRTRRHNGLLTAHNGWKENPSSFQELLDAELAEGERLVGQSADLAVIRSLEGALGRAGQDPASLPTKLQQFKRSGRIREIPALQIFAALIAAIGSEAGADRAKPPNRGAYFDFAAIAHFAPYVDAFLVDRECKRYLEIIATESDLLPATRFYSIDQGQDLLAYLEDTEASADPAHLDLVGQVYGSTWPEPFTALYEWRD